MLPRVCPWCSCHRQCCLCPRFAELLALHECAVANGDADMIQAIEAELAYASIPLAANDNRPDRL